MKRATLLAGLAVPWIGCAAVTFGLINANMIQFTKDLQGRYPNGRQFAAEQFRTCRRGALVTSDILSIMGPLGTLEAVFLSDNGVAGIRYSGVTEAELAQYRLAH